MTWSSTAVGAPSPALAAGGRQPRPDPFEDVLSIGSYALAVPRTDGECRLDEDRGSRLRDFVTQHQGAGELPFVLVHPGARDGRRCWAPDRFAAVATELSRAHGFDHDWRERSA